MNAPAFAELSAAGIEAHIRAYFAACNGGDTERIAGHFEPDAVHYFPPGMYEGPFCGACTIGRRWAQVFATLGSYWTVEQVIVDAGTRRAAIEWSHFKRRSGVLLRGDEWYRYSARGLIVDIRAYYASPQDAALARLELGGWDYEGLGDPLAATPEATSPRI